MASTSPARADILGVSGTIQDWICGIVSPEEPWQGVGDGPESWMSNRNLADIKPAAVKVVSAHGDITTVPAPNDIPPTGMDQLSSIPAGNYTLYEVAGLRGLSWTTIPLNANGTRNCSLWNYMWSQTANLIVTVKNDALQVIISVKEAAAAPDPLNFLYDQSNGLMSTIFTLVFVPIATLMLLLSALWLGIQSARGKGGIRAAVSVVGATFALVALGAFMYTSVVSDHQTTNGFRTVAHVVDEGISTVNAVATNGMFYSLTSDTSGPCALPANNASAAQGQRVTSCVLADTLAYRPWAIGEFGGSGAHPIPLPADWTAVMPDAKGVIAPEQLKGQKTLPCYVNFDKCADLRTYLIAQHGGIQVGGQLNGHQGYLICSASATVTVTFGAGWLSIFLPIRVVAARSFTIDTSAVCSPMFRVFIVLASTNPAVAAAYSGDVGIARVSQAFSSLIGTAIAGGPVLVIALLTMTWTAMTFVLYLTGAFKLPYAVYAGKIKLAKAWFGDLVYAWSARLVYGLILNIMILLITWLLNSTMSFGMQLAWLSIILFSFFKLIQKVQELIRPGVASLRVDPIKAGRTIIREGRRRSVGGVTGVQDKIQRRRGRAADPTRGKTRRTVSVLTAPISLLSGGLRGATIGSSGPGRGPRNSGISVPGKAQGKTAPTTGPARTPSTSGASRTGAVLVRDIATQKPRQAQPAKGSGLDPTAEKHPLLPPRRPATTPNMPAAQPASPSNAKTGRHASDSHTVQIPRKVPPEPPTASRPPETVPDPPLQAAITAPRLGNPAPSRGKAAGPSTGGTTPRTVKAATKPDPRTPRQPAGETTISSTVKAAPTPQRKVEGPSEK